MRRDGGENRSKFPWLLFLLVLIGGLSVLLFGLDSARYILAVVFVLLFFTTILK